MKDLSQSIARLLQKAANNKDKDSISDWKNRNPQNERFLQNLETYWNSHAETSRSSATSEARQRLISRLSPISEKRHAKTFFLATKSQRIAAILILILTISGLSVYLSSEYIFPTQANWIEVSTQAGQQSKVTLPDGSLVWLNSNTQLKYQMQRKTRKVNLSGEAYFEVYHAEKNPFVVETSEATIKVVGTKFNLSHYPESNITETSLLEGKIELTIDQNNKTAVLNPSEKAIYNATDQSLRIIQYRVSNDISWKEGVLAFENVPFVNLIHKLERFYAVEFRYDEKQFENKHYTGTLDNLSIQSVLDFINLTIPVNYEIDNKTIHLDLKR